MNRPGTLAIYFVPACDKFLLGELLDYSLSLVMPQRMFVDP
jgi:hypothetical protein